MTDPASYYRTNVVKGLALLDAAVSRRVPRIVFSSTCATYGMPVRIPMDEDHPQDPINPYGGSKRAFERALLDYAQAGKIRAVALRYFNAAGCHSDGTLGEDHRPEEHIIPLAVDAALGRGKGLVIHGDDYDTPDGTCIRDYIHVEDLAERTWPPSGWTTARPSAPSTSGPAAGTPCARWSSPWRGWPAARCPRASGRAVRAIPPASSRARTGCARPPASRRSGSTSTAIVETVVRWRREHPDGYGPRR